MNTSELLTAMGVVDRVGLAPLARIAASRPRSLASSTWAVWDERRREVENEVVVNLGNAGAVIRLDSASAGITFAGLTATSTTGLPGAINNWRKQADARIGGGRP